MIFCKSMKFLSVMVAVAFAPSLFAALPLAKNVRKSFITALNLNDPEVVNEKIRFGIFAFWSCLFCRSR